MYCSDKDNSSAVLFSAVLTTYDHVNKSICLPGILLLLSLKPSSHTWMFTELSITVCLK